MFREPYEHFDDDAEQAAVDRIVSGGPVGTIAVAGIAVLLVLAMWFAFYTLVFLPRT